MFRESTLAYVSKDGIIHCEHPGVAAFSLKSYCKPVQMTIGSRITLWEMPQRRFFGGDIPLIMM